MSTRTIKVTVGSISGKQNGFLLDGWAEPRFSLLAGESYFFDQSDPSNANHPLRLSLTVGGSHLGGSEFREGVKIATHAPGSKGAGFSLTVPQTGVPALYIYCSNHRGMGGSSKLFVASDKKDALFGTTLADSLQGFGGDDTLSGLDGNDTLDGGSGSDFLSGGAGNDHLTGGAGKNTLDGGAGSDMADYSAFSPAIRINLNAQTGTSSGTNDRLVSIENVRGGISQDTIIGNASANSLSGGAGNDLLVGGAGRDVIDGDAGNDSLTAFQGGSTLRGGTGEDLLEMSTRYSLVRAGKDGFTWEEARRDAEARGGQLGTIGSQREWELVHGLLPREEAWLGASDSASEGDWKWIDGTPWRFSNWGADEPSREYGGTPEHWLMTRGDSAHWNDEAAGKRISSYLLERNIALPASWNEISDGPFSSSAAKPASFPIESGVNGISGVVASKAPDFFTFTVPTGHVLESFDLGYYKSTDSKAWIGLQKGSAWTAGDNPAGMLAQQHFGPANSNQSLLGVSPATPLKAGTYTVRVQQLGADTRYRLELSVISSVVPFLDGGVGRDTLHGNQNAESLSGGDDADVLIGAGGSDTMRGGNGNDSLSAETRNTYRVVPGSFTFAQAADDAAFQGGQLATIGSPQEWQRVFDVLKPDRAWIGGVFSSETSSWQWVDGTPFGFTFWNAPWEPSKTPGENRVEIRSADESSKIRNWNNENESTPLPSYVLEMEAPVKSARLLGEAGHDTLLGGAGGDFLDGGSGNDSLVGGQSADSLSGGAGNDSLSGCVIAIGGGFGEVDTLLGGFGNDIFQLGWASGRFYDDGNTKNAGRADYVLITDFAVGQDQLQLDGAAANYFLGASGVTNVSGSGLFHDSNANEKLDSTDELIAIIRSANNTALNAANTVNTASFV